MDCLTSCFEKTKETANENKKAAGALAGVAAIGAVVAAPAVVAVAAVGSAAAGAAHLVQNKDHYEGKLRTHLEGRERQRKKVADIDDWFQHTANAVEDAHTLQRLEYAKITDYAVLNTLQKMIDSSKNAPPDLKELGALDGYNAGGSPKVAAAWKIKDPGLFIAYQTSLNQIRDDCKKYPGRPITVQTSEAAQPLKTNLDASVNEVYLWHAPNITTMHTIMEAGFDERYSGASIGTAFGDGSYFAEDFMKADQYSVRDEGMGNYSSDYSAPALAGSKVQQAITYSRETLQDVHKVLYPGGDHPKDVFYVFLNRVVLGHYVEPENSIIDKSKQPEVFAMGGTNYRQLAAIPQSKPSIPYHALVATPHKFKSPNTFQSRNREFVVMSGAQIYPEYLIAFKRNA